MSNYCKDVAETFPGVSATGELPWLVSKLLQLCLLESFLPSSLGNFSVTAIKHQLQTYWRLHATSWSGAMKQAAIWPVSFCFSWETSWATERDRTYPQKGLEGVQEVGAANKSHLKSPALHDGAELYKTGTTSNKWFSELRFWSNSSHSLPAAEDQEGRTWNFKTPTGDWYKPSCREFQQLKSGSHLSIISG